MITSSTRRSAAESSSRSLTQFACARARVLPRVPRRISVMAPASAVQDSLRTHYASKTGLPFTSFVIQIEELSKRCDAGEILVGGFFGILFKPRDGVMEDLLDHCRCHVLDGFFLLFR